MARAAERRATDGSARASQEQVVQDSKDSLPPSASLRWTCYGTTKAWTTRLTMMTRA
jgi:hypothetical protein